MPLKFQFQTKPETAAIEELLNKAVAIQLRIDVSDIQKVVVEKRSIDARQKKVKINLKGLAYLKNEQIEERKIELPDYPNVANAREVLIVGAGPAGLFAALQLIEKGLKPIILERGKEVRKRRVDLRMLNLEHIVNEDSNYCFGEGGAGTFSDGKLYTRSKKRGDVDKIIQLFVGFGASPNIMIEAHPHIGTDKLPRIIQNIRHQILACGGEIHFEKRVTNFIIKNNAIKGVKTQDHTIYNAEQVILATGHSARDIYELLYHKGILIEAKPFALGVRAEHAQDLIDTIQYSCDFRGDYLPPAPYSIVKQVNGRGMYSFCMCPGGVIAPSATAPGEVVTNGWSPSKRNLKTANSGIVVELRIEDFKAFKKFGALAGMEFQRSIEQKAWTLAGKTQRVPAQRMVDFTKKITSTHIPKTSYIPGTSSIELGEVFPNFITQILRDGFVHFGKTMHGYLTNEAVLHAPESRTSSPVRIPRNPLTLEHLQIKGLYPCGEGAGYAGGIISAAIDGEKCAEQISKLS